MSHRSRLALGLVGGYLLGRYRKTRWLVAVAALVASKRLGEAALQRGDGEGGSAPELKKLADQGRETAASLLANQMRGLSSRIHSKTESLQESSAGPQGDEEAESTEASETSAQEAGEQDEEAGEQDEEAGEQDEEATEQPKGRAESEEQPESAAPSSSKGATKGGKPAERSGGSRSNSTASGERAQVSGRPEGLGAARRRR